MAETALTDDAVAEADGTKDADNDDDDASLPAAVIKVKDEVPKLTRKRARRGGDKTDDEDADPDWRAKPKKKRQAANRKALIESRVVQAYMGNRPN